MKWNSIVTKISLTILLLLLLVLFPLAFTINQIFSGIYLNDVSEQLEGLSKKYAQSIKTLEDDKLLTMFELLGELTEQEIVIVNAEGQTVANSAQPETLADDYVKPADIKRLRNGQTVQRQINNVNRHIFVAQPIMQNGTFLGAVYVFTTVEGVIQSIEKVRQLLILAGAGAVLIALGFIFFASRELSTPLLEIEEATRKIAKGNLKIRLNIKSKDEIGDLGNAINEMAEHLDRIETTRSEFFANISHELRTPLTYLQGYSSALKHKLYETEAEKEEYIDIIEKESARITKLVDDLYELSKMEEGKYELHFSEVNLNEMIEDVVSRMKIMAKEKGLEINSLFASNENLIVYADESRLEQVMINLIENAVKYTEKGSITIKISQNAKEAVLIISDTGIGIPKEETPYLFERFYRVEKSRSRDFGGTGLGLSIVKQLVELQYGKIEVQSEVGKGTNFIIYLPIFEEGAI